MQVACIFPNKRTEGVSFERQFESIRRRFGDDVEVVYLAHGDYIELYQKSYPELSIERFEGNSKYAECRHVVVVWDYIKGFTTEMANRYKAPSKRVYVSFPEGRMLMVYPFTDEEEHPHIEKNTFSRLALKHSEPPEMFFFPHAYLSFHPGWGPMDEFGFRIEDNDWRLLKDRPKEHIVINLYGGSAAWGYFSFHDEMFASRLEEKLNAYSKGKDLGLNFTVLNFAGLGQGVLDEQSMHMIFGSLVEPDIVIAHDGWNDFHQGLTSDPELLGNFAYAHSYTMESWAQILHKSAKEPQVQKHWHYVAMNGSHNVLSAYVKRKGVFRRFVESTGAQFVWGMQPCIYSKSARSDQEKKWLSQELWYGVAQYCFLQQKIEYLYDEFESLVSLPDDLHYINLHRTFKEYGEEDTLFRDHMHMTPDGEERVAEHYFHYFCEKIIPGMEGGR